MPRDPDKHREQSRRSMQKWRRANPEKAREIGRRWRQRNPGRHLKYSYGLTIEDFERMKVEQNGQCKLCSKPLTGKICIDHNHATGKIRGLLCNLCNTRLGWYERLRTKIERYVR